MTDKAASQPAMIRKEDKSSYEASHRFDRKQLYRFPRLIKVAHSDRLKLINRFLDLLSSHDIKCSLISVETSHLNLVERMHVTLGDVIRTNNFENIETPMREIDILLLICA